jgi:hypothetical protein
MYYLGRVKFEIVNDDNGRIRTMKEQYLIEGETIENATEKLRKEFKDTLAEFSIEKIEESKIVGIIK